MNPLCQLLGHHRSRRRARQDSLFEWRSVCERCGRPMVRLAPHQWVLEDQAPPRERKDASH